MIMKMHSYVTVNGQLQQVKLSSDAALSRLQKAAESSGGLDKAVDIALAQHAEEQAKASLTPIATSNSTHEPTPIGTPPVPDGLETSYVDVGTANALRKRLTAIQQTRSDSSTSSAEGYSGPGNFAYQGNGAPEMDVHGVRSLHKLHYKDALELHQDHEEDAEEELPEALRPHPLIYHPESEISALAKEYSDLQSELVSSGPLYLRWPENVTWKNFGVYQLVPTLVYELEYPRTEKCVFLLASSLFLLTSGLN